MIGKLSTYLIGSNILFHCAGCSPAQWKSSHQTLVGKVAPTTCTWHWAVRRDEENEHGVCMNVVVWSKSKRVVGQWAKCVCEWWWTKGKDNGSSVGDTTCNKPTNVGSCVEHMINNTTWCIGQLLDCCAPQCSHTTYQETSKVLVYLDIYGQVIISLMLVDKCIYSIVCLKS